MPKTNLQTSWNLTPLFKDNSDPKIVILRQEAKRAHVAFETTWKTNAKYLRDVAVLKQALDQYEQLERQFASNSSEAYYFWLKSELDTTNSELKAYLQKTIDFSHELTDHIRFFTQNLAKIDLETQNKFLRSPLLNEYKHFLEKLFLEGKYLLTESEERILDLKSTGAKSAWEEMVNGLFSREERLIQTKNNGEIKKNFSEIMTLLSDPDKMTRDSAARALNDIFKEHAFVVESEINAILGDKKIDDTLRKVERPDILRHLDDDIDTQTVDTMLSVVESKFNISREYYEFKAKLFGQKQLAYHERNLVYGETRKHFSFETGYELVHEVFSELDPEFGQILERFVANGQVDVFPKKGKSSGAFCAHNLLADPTYILLNYGDKLVDVTVLAHEAGHGINNELTRSKQNALYFETPTSTAEVASTFMEDFVIEKLSHEITDEERLSLLVSKLDNDISTIFRQVACYRFEQELHAKYRASGHLSIEEIGKMFQKHMVSYMGEGVEQSAGSENWWMYWSHIRAYFYVYSYASGLLISKSLQASVKQDPKFITQVKNFLSAGSSQTPQDIFMALGINISQKEFWETGLSEIETKLNQAKTLALKLGRL